MTMTDEPTDVEWERQPPQNLDAEAATLGAMMLSKDAIADVVEVLGPTDFYRPAHQAIYDAILSLYTNGEPADAVTVARRLGKELTRAGGPVYLVTLTQTPPTASSAAYYAQMVADMAGMRRLVEAGTRIVQYGYAGADGADTAEVRDRAQAEIYEATKRGAAAEVLSLRQSIPIAHTELLAIHEHGGIGGVPTGYRELDDIVHGLHPGELIIVAGRPAMGKSTVALDVLRCCSVINDLPAVLFSFEMSRTEVIFRLLSAETNIPLNRMRKGELNDQEWVILADRMEQVDHKPLFIDDSAHMTMMEIRAKARRLKQQHGLRLIVVDYLQLMTSGKRVESRQTEVAELSRQLKLLAKELEVPVVALSQLNRNPEARADKRPQVSDLRESGAVEQDADLVILVHRPEVYEDDSTRAGEADLIVGKHRNGPVGVATVAARLTVAKFVDMAPEWRTERNRY